MQSASLGDDGEDALVDEAGDGLLDGGFVLGEEGTDIEVVAGLGGFDGFLSSGAHRVYSTVGSGILA